jgi:hypothetical protein
MSRRLALAISRRIGLWIWTEATLAERERIRQMALRHGYGGMAELLRKDRIHG